MLDILKVTQPMKTIWIQLFSNPVITCSSREFRRLQLGYREHHVCHWLVLTKLFCANGGSLTSTTSIYGSLTNAYTGSNGRMSPSWGARDSWFVEDNYRSYINKWFQKCCREQKNWATWWKMDADKFEDKWLSAVSSMRTHHDERIISTRLSS